MALIPYDNNVVETTVDKPQAGEIVVLPGFSGAIVRSPPFYELDLFWFKDGVPEATRRLAKRIIACYEQRDRDESIRLRKGNLPAALRRTENTRALQNAVLAQGHVISTAGPIVRCSVCKLHWRWRADQQLPFIVGCRPIEDGEKS